MAPLRVCVLISGRGSNLKSLIDHQGRYTIVGVASNNPQAAGLAFAESSGIATAVVPHRDYSERAAFDADLAECIEAWQPGLVVLAGFMRILGDAFVRRFTGRMINIHPSLLPKYPGLHTHQRALDADDRWHGASTHFVTAELDGGPVIAQVRIPIREGDDADSLAARLLVQEHRLMVDTVDRIARGEVQYRHDQVYFRGESLENPIALDPA